MKKNKTYIVDVHSLIDVITNSSSELFIVDANKIEGTLKELFEFIIGDNEIDYETSVRKFDDDSSKDNFILPECYKDDTSSLYMINADQSNYLLQHIIQEYFNPIPIKWKDEE